MDYSDEQKKHEDQVIPRGTTLYTLSYDLNRTRNASMFYAVFKEEDLNQYLTMLNGSLIKSNASIHNESLEIQQTLKYELTSLVCADLLMASEDSAASIFTQLVQEDVDFCDFVVNPQRMQSHFEKSKYLFKGYRTARKALSRIRIEGGSPSSEDLMLAYRMFNYVIPSDGKGDQDKARDVATQRDKFFASMRAAGYGAVLDTNDALYGGFRASAPIIVFDTTCIMPGEARETTGEEKDFTQFIAAAARLVGGSDSR